MTVVGIVGPGRAGVGLGFALSRAGHRVFLHGRQAKNLPVALDHTWGGTPPWITAADVIVLAVSDDGIGPVVARELQASRYVQRRHIVMHLSGVLDRSALEPVALSGAALGSFHPLQALHDPLTAPEQLKGSVVMVEGDDAAVELAWDLARSLGLHPFRVPSEHKAVYHAAEIFLSTFVIVLASVAERLLRDTGASPREIWQMLSPVLAGTMEGLRRRGTGGSLAGPLAWGEAVSVECHLEALPAENQELYRALAREALRLADLPAARALRAVLEPSAPKESPPEHPWAPRS